jgi:hypothetical protein
VQVPGTRVAYTPSEGEFEQVCVCAAWLGLIGTDLGAPQTASNRWRSCRMAQPPASC